MAHHDADPNATGRTVFILTVVSALAFAFCAYLLTAGGGQP